MSKMTVWGAKKELEQAILIVERVSRSAGNPVIKGSCTQALNILKPMAASLHKVNFDGEDQNVLNL